MSENITNQLFNINDAARNTDNQIKRYDIKNNDIKNNDIKRSESKESEYSLVQKQVDQSKKDQANKSDNEDNKCQNNGKNTNDVPIDNVDGSQQELKNIDQTANSNDVGQETILPIKEEQIFTPISNELGQHTGLILNMDLMNKLSASPNFEDKSLDLTNQVININKDSDIDFSQIVFDISDNEQDINVSSSINNILEEEKIDVELNDLHPSLKIFTGKLNKNKQNISNNNDNDYKEEYINFDTIDYNKELNIHNEDQKIEILPSLLEQNEDVSLPEELLLQINNVNKNNSNIENNEFSDIEASDFSNKKIGEISSSSKDDAENKDSQNNSEKNLTKFLDDEIIDLQESNDNFQLKEVKGDLNTSSSNRSEVKLNDKLEKMHDIKNEVKNLHIVDMVKVKLEDATRNGSKRMVIELQPKELGKVEINLEKMASNQYKISIFADKQESLGILKQEISKLEEPLHKIGIMTDGSPNFNLKDSNREHHQNQEFTTQNNRNTSDIEDHIMADKFYRNSIETLTLKDPWMVYDLFGSINITA